MTQRIASLLASATEIVCALGLEERLVAISHECDYPPQVLGRPRISRPRFDPAGLGSGAVDAAVRQALLEHGSVYAIDGDALAGLDPDLILSQAVCEVCAVPTPGVRQVVAERGLRARILSLDAHTLEEILDSIIMVGEAAGAERAAAALVQALESRLARIEAAVRGLERLRVLALEWLDPPFAPGHWVPQMIESAGGTSLAGERAARSRELSWDGLHDLDPDVLVVMPCGYGLDAAAHDADLHAERLMEVAHRAVQSGGAFVVDGSAYFNRSGPRVVAGVEILAGLLHPDYFPPPPADQARAWRPAAAVRGAAQPGDSPSRHSRSGAQHREAGP